MNDSKNLINPVYVYYANKLFEIADLYTNFHKSFLNFPDGAYYIQPNGRNEWLIKLSSSGQYIDEDTVPPETKALHLLLTL